MAGDGRSPLPSMASPQPPPPPQHRRCALNGSGCVSLANVVHSLNIPINEEQAWAICYQCVKCVMELRDDGKSPNVIYLVTDMGQVFLGTDGTVHPETFVQPTLHQGGERRERASSEARLVENLGAVVYQALDFSVDPEEERRLSSPLDDLINRMTATLDHLNTSSSSSSSSASANHGHEADEGIEEDGGGPEMELVDRSGNYFSLKQVLESCSSHLSSPGQSEIHYKAVCRALVTEALELSTFLEKISEGTQELRRHVTVTDELEQLNVHDWARLWVQVIDELRRGVKLKKVQLVHPQHPIEYALTPYEILMDDIRSRRYKLNKVMVNGDLPPRVKKDAHTIILEFIRSRPPLKPVSKRPIRPVAPEPPSRHERLMRSIRSKTHSLRPTHGTSTVGGKSVAADRSSAAVVGGVMTADQSTRRLIKADTDLFNLNFDEDDDPLPSPLTPADVISTDNAFSRTTTTADDVTSPPNSTHHHHHHHLSPNWQKTVTLDLTKHGQVLKPERRHSISDVTPSSPVTDDVALASLPPQSTTTSSSAGGGGRPSQRHLCRSMLWKNSLECLSLTLEEVVHIRNVLTKAELENLLAGTHLYEDVAKGKLCFLCKKTRFSFFGPWKHLCRLCRRTVCDKCCSKMRIPTEHFANIPVYTLSPSPSSSGDEDSAAGPSSSSFFRPWADTQLNTNSGSAPSTPMSTPRHPHPEQLSTPSSPVTSLADPSQAKRRLGRSKTIQRDSVGAEKLRGSLMTVCRECKSMVCHVIVASRNSLALKQRSGRLNATFPWRIRPASVAVDGHNNDTEQQQQQHNGPKDRDTITSQFRLNLTPIYNGGQQN